MRTLDEWLKAYSETHQNPTNRLIHKICIPLIMFSLLGLLFSIPFPIEHGPGFTNALFYNWASVFMVGCLIFYLRLSAIYSLIMLFVGSLMLIGLTYYEQFTNGNVLLTSIVVFVVSWILQFVGHKIEGKKPAFIEDLQFLLIGPLWTVATLQGKDDL